MNGLRNLGISVLLSAAILIGLVLMFPGHQPAPDTKIATESNEVKNTTKVDVPAKKPVNVYSGGSTLKKKLDLPADVVQNDAQHILASSKVDGDRPHTITTIINTDTGESQTFDRLDPLPWLASDRHGRLGMYVLVKNGTPTVSLQAQRGLFSIKAVHVGLVAGLDQPMSGNDRRLNSQFGVGAEYEF